MKMTHSLLFAALLGCAGSAKPEPEHDHSEDVEECSFSYFECTMAGKRCPSADLPRFEAELDTAGWARLRELAQERVVAVVLGEQVELIEDCQLPGRYHEAVAAEESPGRAWSSDRLSLLPDELHGCGRATHFVAAFAIRGADEGSAIVLPLPCPPLGSGPPEGCIGAGLDDAAREQAASERWQLAKQLEGDDWRERALPLVLESAALVSTPEAYASVARLLERLLVSERHGGCLWFSDAVFSAQVFNPSFEPRHEGWMSERLTPEHEPNQCYTRPSLLTCFPEHFVPGVGGNCW